MSLPYNFEYPSQQYTYLHRTMEAKKWIQTAVKPEDEGDLTSWLQRNSSDPPWGMRRWKSPEAGDIPASLVSRLIGDLKKVRRRQGDHFTAPQRTAYRRLVLARTLKKMGRKRRRNMGSVEQDIGERPYRQKLKEAGIMHGIMYDTPFTLPIGMQGGVMGQVEPTDVTIISDDLPPGWCDVLPRPVHLGEIQPIPAPIEQIHPPAGYTPTFRGGLGGGGGGVPTWAWVLGAGALAWYAWAR